MIIRGLTSCAVWLLVALVARGADAPIEVVIAYEQGVQITAPQEWLQQFTRLGIDNVQVRSQRRGDKPQLDTLGTAERPRYRLIGVLNDRNQLQFPGRRFSARDTARLGDYLRSLAADGAEGILAAKGQFGLTEKQLAGVIAELSAPTELETEGKPLRDVLNKFDEQLAITLSIDPAARDIIAGDESTCDDVSTLTRGSALAVLLAQRNLALIPVKERGEEVILRIVVMAEDEEPVESWPVGWEIEGNRREAAPTLFEFLTVEIQDHTLEQAIDALEPRIEMPIYWDHAKLARESIDPAAIKVKLARTKTFHKRILDKLLFQARLRGETRADEAGTPFVWISR